MKTKSIKKIAIIGVGFMGGSLALALKKKFCGVSIWGYARNEKSYRKLKKLKILDKVEKSLKKAVEGADLVVLALPTEAIAEHLKIIAPFLKKESIIFDLGSSKKLIEKAAAKYLPKSVNFVGCHPICGSEKSGAEFSYQGLYQGALCLVTSSSKQKAVEAVKNIWESLGSKVVFINSDYHDKILSKVSHLPHLVSFSLTHSIPNDYSKFCGKGFKDLTRISSSPASVWADILLSNRKNILKDLKGFIKELKKFEILLEVEDKDKLLNLINKINIKQKIL
ncbi:MAG: prephenate dehydrogenase [Candidatus Omnitrophota bacterium]